MLNRRQTSTFSKNNSSVGFPPSLPTFPSSARSRVHSAPPTSENRHSFVSGRLPPIDRTNGVERRTVYMDKPSTPDPDQVRRILEQRIAQALSGPVSRLKRQETSGDDCLTPIGGRRRSLIRSSAIGSEEFHLVPVDDEEMAMLRSITKSQYSKGSMGSSTSKSFSSEALYKHEYEDKSSDEEEIGEQLRNRRKLSMVRQEEQEDDMEISIETMHLGDVQTRRPSGIRNMEERLAGMRHEKMRSSTKSGEIEDDQISGLVYDKEFDCYYNPKTDRYYRLKSQSKSGEGILQTREM
uniref:Uncharacterized protein n=1 Tax=Caenorhabditis japonica TaxID=281687 RepID=A0A8R1DQ41_CAEJA